MEIKFKKLDPRAVAPVRAHDTDAGFDLTCLSITTEINECGQLILVYHSGIAIEIPEGHFALLTPRSSISKKSIMLTDGCGVIDAGYRGEVLAKFRSTTDVVPSLFKEGERFCQLIILPLPDVKFVEAEQLEDSDRGENGYGSSDLKEDSAPMGSAGYPEQKSELTDQETTLDGSGEAQSSLEQAE